MEFAYAFDQKMSTQTNGCFEEMLSAEHVSPSEHEASSWRRIVAQKLLIFHLKEL